MSKLLAELNRRVSLVVTLVLTLAFLVFVFRVWLSSAQAAPPGAPLGLGQYGAVVILNTATPIPATPLPSRNALGIVNLGAATIYCGWDQGVTATNGYPVAPNGGTLGVDITYDYSGARPKLYCIAAVSQVAPLSTRWMEVR